MYQNCFTVGPFTEMKSTLCQVHQRHQSVAVYPPKYRILAVSSFEWLVYNPVSVSSISICPLIFSIYRPYRIITQKYASSLHLKTLTFAQLTCNQFFYIFYILKFNCLSNNEKIFLFFLNIDIFYAVCFIGLVVLLNLIEFRERRANVVKFARWASKTRINISIKSFRAIKQHTCTFPCPSVSLGATPERSRVRANEPNTNDAWDHNLSSTTSEPTPASLGDLYFLFRTCIPWVWSTRWQPFDDAFDGLSI